MQNAVQNSITKVLSSHSALIVHYAPNNTIPQTSATGDGRLRNDREGRQTFRDHCKDTRTS